MLRVNLTALVTGGLPSALKRSHSELTLLEGLGNGHRSGVGRSLQVTKRCQSAAGERRTPKDHMVQGKAFEKDMRSQIVRESEQHIKK